MKTTSINYMLAVVFSLGSITATYAGEVFNFAGNDYVLSDAPSQITEGEKFEFAGNSYVVPAREKADADLAALEGVDELDSLIWSDDDPDIVLIGK